MPDRIRLDTDPDAAAALAGAVQEWLPGQVQYLLDRVNEYGVADVAWAELDDFATQCEMMARGGPSTRHHPAAARRASARPRRRSRR